MSQVDIIKQKIKELQDEVDLLETGTASCVFWQNLLQEGGDSLTVTKVTAIDGQRGSFLIRTTTTKDFGRLARLNAAGYHVDAFRVKDDDLGGSTFWIDTN